MSSSLNRDGTSVLLKNLAALTLRAMIAFGIACPAALWVSSVSAKPASALTVQTSQGPVTGFLKTGIAEFLGIPYAAPPVGNLRWRPPQARQSWSKALSATNFGPQCAQVTLLGGVFRSPRITTKIPLSKYLFAAHSE